MATGTRSRRQILRVAMLVGAAALGGLILGEYSLDGVLPYLAGALYGWVLAEIALAVGGEPPRWVAALAGGSACGGFMWAGWIASGEGTGPIHLGTWLGAVLSAAVAFGWVRRAIKPSS